MQPTTSARISYASLASLTPVARPPGLFATSPKQRRGSLWHAYRRKWATERKHLPVQDVAGVGGWKSNAMVLNIYTQADDETMLQVVLGAGELREAR